MKKKYPLSARRNLNTSDQFETDLANFLQTPIRLESFSPNINNNHFQTPRRPKTAPKLTRQNETKKAPTSDDIYSGRRRAFEVKYEIKRQEAIKQAEKQWEDKIRYGKWKRKKEKERIKVNRSSKDNHVIEDIISQRSSFLSSQPDLNQQPKKPYVCSRVLPPEITTRTRSSCRTFYWGA